MICARGIFLLDMSAVPEVPSVAITPTNASMVCLRPLLISCPTLPPELLLSLGPRQSLTSLFHLTQSPEYTP